MDLLKQVKCFTIDDMALMLGVSEKSIRNKISNLRLRRYKSIGPNGIAVYTEEQLDQIRGNKKKHELVFNYKPYNYSKEPVIITYYIYESKMNK